MIIEITLGFLIPFTFLMSLPIPIILSNFKSDQMNQGIKNARKWHFFVAIHLLSNLSTYPCIIPNDLSITGTFLSDA